MNANPIHQIIRIQLLTNSNFGAASGRVTLDRPTQIDAYLELPFIPNSSLRGVIRNFWEIIASPSVDTEKVFGSRREEEEEPPVREENKPGKLMLGNGELIAFPVHSTTVERCWIVPMHNVVKYLSLEILTNTPFPNPQDIQTLAKAVFKSDEKQAMGIPYIPDLSLPFPLKQIAAPDYENEIKSLLALLTRWHGDWLPDNEPKLVVNDEVARYLWQREAEIRDMTALTPKKKTAKPQSLRRIETIPEGSVFLSFVSWYGDGTVDLCIDALQAGSGEGTGLGFCRIAPTAGVIRGDVEMSFNELEDSGESVTESEIMREIYKAVQDASNRNNSFREKLRSAIRTFGWRMIDEGLPAAIAFALAKAKPFASRQNLNDEKEAYRWLLKTVLGISGDLKKYGENPWFSEDFSAEQKRLIKQRWLWLRKYSEYELTEA